MDPSGSVAFPKGYRYDLSLIKLGENVTVVMESVEDDWRFIQDYDNCCCLIVCNHRMRVMASEANLRVESTRWFLLSGSETIERTNTPYKQLFNALLLNVQPLSLNSTTTVQPIARNRHPGSTFWRWTGGNSKDVWPAVRDCYWRGYHPK
jgi:hypothetical protein